MTYMSWCSINENFKPEVCSKQGIPDDLCTLNPQGVKCTELTAAECSSLQLAPSALPNAVQCKADCAPTCHEVPAYCEPICRNDPLKCSTLFKCSAP